MSRRPGDQGLFGPNSVSWQVHRETTVLFGGARAILMQAAHPLVIAGARSTGFYERNPWRRLERTLRLTYTITFGSEREALAAAERINEVHRTVHGVDEVTGKRYDALDPDLLLWVHACLVDSALLFERLTVGRLDDEAREQFHREQMLAAELLELPRDRIPTTVPDLRRYIDEVVHSGDLVVTDASRTVADLFRNVPREADWRPVLRGVARWAFGTLPSPLRSQYEVRSGLVEDMMLRASFALVRRVRPALPRRYRWIGPARDAFAAARDGGAYRPEPRPG